MRTPGSPPPQRSPNRPAEVPFASRVTGKDKAARVPLDYFRTVGKRKVAVALIALLVTAAALGASLASGYWRDLASPGKVHSVHIAWEHDCSACHTPGQPTGSRNGLRGVLGTGPVSDALCKNCHAGPPHHAREIEGDAGSCASCHVEHRGRHSSLTRMSDSSCTRCHANLEGHMKGTSSEFATKIKSFALDHPQFNLGPAGKRQPLGKALDPGNLKFNHKLHLIPGQRDAVKAAGGWTLGDIKDNALRERYRRQQPAGQDKDSSLVQLDCASCHVLDASGTAESRQTLAPRADGAYMLPVTYEQHCKACHPLTFDPALPGVQVPHPLQPADVKRFLWGVFSAQEVKALESKMKGGTDRPLPGHNLTREEKEARARMKDKVVTAAKFLFQEDLGKAAQFVFKGKTTCGLCHLYEGKAVAGIPAQIRPVNVPRVWYEHGKFSHKAHRTVQCLDCHQGATESTKHTDVLLPGIENCRTCHAPAARVDGKKRGGVRYDCVTCHRYHHGDVPDAGLGAAARGVRERRTMQEVLGK
jgi:hypothetical protein